MLELVSAYAPFANGGLGVWPHGITEIRDGAGKIVFRRTGSGSAKSSAPELTGTMNQMLSAVIGHGTGKSAALPRPAAGKTGTTQDYRDAWFIGYTADLVAGVWLGNDDNAPMNKVTGGSLPAQTWRRFMLTATQAMPVRPLPSGPLPPAGSAGRGAAAFGRRVLRQFLWAFQARDNGCDSPHPPAVAESWWVREKQTSAMARTMPARPACSPA